jgi:hypothetical protein
MTDQPGCPCSICDEDADPTATRSDPRAGTKRPQVDASANIRSAEKLGLVDDGDDLRDRIAAILSRELPGVSLTGPLADVIVEGLGLRREWGALNDDDEGVLSDTREGLKPWGTTETVKGRWITEWQEAEET